MAKNEVKGGYVHNNAKTRGLKKRWQCFIKCMYVYHTHRHDGLDEMVQCLCVNPGILWNGWLLLGIIRDHKDLTYFN